MNKVTLTLTLNLHRNMAALGLVSFSLSLLTLDLNTWSTVAFSRAFFIGRSISHQQGYLMRTARSFSSCNEVHAKPLPWETVEDCDETSLTHRIMNRSDRNENSVFKVSALAKLLMVTVLKLKPLYVTTIVVYRYSYPSISQIAAAD